MKDSVILLKNKFRDRLGSIRNVPGWKAAADEGEIWLRGPVNNGPFQNALSSLPAEANYLMDDDGRLFPVGKQTPVRILKELAWQSLRDFLPLEIPVSAMPGETGIRVQLKVKRSLFEQEAYALKTTFRDWKVYVESAPAIRLQRLRFAVSGKKEVLVIGSPLPALKGQFCWRNKNLLLPAGFDFDPPVLADLLPTTSDVVLFDELGNRETIPAAAFAAADRTTVRLLDRR
jgi:hypothetical protein